MKQLLATIHTKGFSDGPERNVYDITAVLGMT